MSDFLARIGHFSPKRLALLADELNSRVEQLERASHAPVAIVGIGCRFPGGADTPEAFWQLVRDGIDAVTEVPPDRWAIDDYFDPDPDRAGKMSTRWGGFVGPVDGFDPAFFGISPREAHSMDPQQRLLLEVTWRALEHAAIAPPQLEGSRTAVYLGMSAGDYYQLMHRNGVESFDAYTASGIAHSIASGRLSYVLGLRGPSVSIDTACSSSLVAIHHAVHSLRRGECDLALAGGVNLILGPDITIALSRSHMMAPDGRCKAFDARADGFVRGEGCGMLVLRRLADAQAAGDRIVAVIRGTAANQDGRSNGLTAPNGPSQEAVLRDALDDARVDPAQVGFVEAHGTGTALGDPIEVQALAKVIGPAHTHDAPLWVGSVKANVGHLEAAAGVAGVVKLAMALQHGQIPGQVHLQRLNPFIPWDEIAVRPPAALMPWPACPPGGRLGGISSFGFSGTNVHLLIGEAPAQLPAQAHETRPRHLLTVSARNDAALRTLAQRYRDRLAEPGVSLPDLAFTANAGRAHFAQRLALVASSPAEAALRLDQHLAGDLAEGLAEGTAGARAPRIAFLFTGQGSQYAGMARELYDTQPSFRATLERCDELLREHLARPLLSVLFPAAGEAASIDETEYTQPALFAVEYALATLWMSWGVRPNAVMGHSVGEYVAACVAGVFSLEDGLKLIAERGRLMGALPRNGAMAAVMADEARVRAALAPWSRDLSVAAVNGPQNTVVSGLAASLDALLAQLEAEGITATRLKVSHAFHSPLVEPMLEAFAAVAAGVQFHAPQVDLVSNVTGQVAGAQVAGAAYWREHVRAAVQFAPALQTLARGGCDVYLEIGPHPTLLGMGRLCVAEGEGRWLPSLRRGRGDWEQMLESLAVLYTAGAAIDWSGFDAGRARRKIVLAGYPFQRERYWVEPLARVEADAGRTLLHPLLGWELVQSLGDERLFETRLHPSRLPWLEDHRILGSLLLPSPAHMEMALAAAALQFGEGPLQVDDFTVHQALALDGPDPVTAQLVLAAPADGHATFRINALDASTRRWNLQASGRVGRAGTPPPAAADLAAIRARTTQSIGVADYYAWLGTLGLEFGPRFRGVEAIQRCDGEVLAEMRLPDSLAAQAQSYRLHPALLDACFHVIGAALPGGGTVLKDAFLLLNVERIRVHRPLGATAWNHVVVHADDRAGLATRETFRADLRLVDDQGLPLAEFEGMHFKRASAAALTGGRMPARVRSMLHELVWREARAAAGSLPSPATLRTRTAPLLADMAAAHGLDGYAGFLPRLDQLAAAYIVKALRTLGFGFGAGERFEAGPLAARLGVLPQHRRLFERMLAILAEDGVLAPHGASWQVLAAPPPRDPDALCDELLARHTDGTAELQLTRRCARELADVLRGRADPLALLFPGGSLADTERLYRDSPPARAYNGLIAGVFEALVADAPQDRPLRILEIGAGTGSTTAYVLPRLPQSRVEYTFTDVSPLFLNRARDKFGDKPFMRYELLDIGRAPAEQGFADGSFDVVVGANVLHATADLDVTVGHVRGLLAPGGVLVLLEGTTPQRFGDLTVGLLDGWWAYSDLQRRQYALMPRERWLALLAERGFDAAVALPGETRHPVLAQQAVFVARAPLPARAAARWLVVPDAGGVAAALTTTLRAGGDHVDLLPAPGDVDFGTVLRAALSNGQPLQGVVSLAALDQRLHDGVDSGALMQGQQRLVGGTLELVQALAAGTGVSVPRLWLVTRGAQSALPPEGADPAQATLWGMSHVIAIEHPELRCTRIDLDPAADAGTAAQGLQAELQGTGREDQIALRGQRRLVRRLVHQAARPDDTARLPVRIDAQRSYLVTGGLRGLGPRIAQWLADQGARHLVLMGRQAPTPAAQGLIDTLRSRGVQVLVATGDVAQAGDVERMLHAQRQSMPALAGVVHSAGALDDGVLLAQSWPRFAAVMAAKVQGSWNLHRLVADLDFLVLFSSGASVAGSAGQANHAAANAFEDALAWYRQAQGRPTVSINWGPWADIGAAAERKLAQPGMLDAIAPADGLLALESALRRDVEHGLFRPAQLAVLATDWAHLREAPGDDGPPPLFSELVVHARATPVTAAQSAQSRAAEPSLRERLEVTAPNRRRTVLRDQVRQLTCKVLGLQRVDDLPVDEPLRQLGLDSLMAVELRNLLGKAVGQTLPATVTFDHPSVTALVEHLAGTVFAAEIAAAAPSAPPPAPADTRAAAATAALDAMSEDELALRLLSRLDHIGSQENP